MNCTKCDELRADLERARSDALSVKSLRSADIVIFNAELERMKRAAKESCETEAAIEKLCASVLGQAFVDGDSTSVPGPEACVAEVVGRLDLVQKREASMRDVLKQINELRFQPHGVHDRFAHALALAENALAQAKSLGLE